MSYRHHNVVDGAPLDWAPYFDYCPKHHDDVRSHCKRLTCKWLPLIGDCLRCEGQSDTLPVALDAYESSVETNRSTEEGTMEITVSELAAITGKSLQNLNMLIKRGVLPEGVKRGKKRFLDKEQCLQILNSQAQPFGHYPVRADVEVTEEVIPKSADVAAQSLIAGAAAPETASGATSALSSTTVSTTPQVSSAPSWSRLF